MGISETGSIGESYKSGESMGWTMGLTAGLFWGFFIGIILTCELIGRLLP